MKQNHGVSLTKLCSIYTSESVVLPLMSVVKVQYCILFKTNQLNELSAYASLKPWNIGYLEN